MNESVDDVFSSTLEEMDGCEDGNNVDTVVHSRRKKSRRGKQNEFNRKINHEWTEDEVIRLIGAVKKESALWNTELLEYKQSKVDSWRSVVKQLGIDAVDLNEAKTKWASLRVSFKQNLNKMREKTNAKFVVWRHFRHMLFLDDASQSTLPLSNDSTVEKDLPESQLPTTSRKRKRRGNAGIISTPPPALPPSPASASSHIQGTVSPTPQTDTSTLQTAIPALQTAAPMVQVAASVLQAATPPLQDAPTLRAAVPVLQTAPLTLQTEVPALQAADTNSAFCDYLFCELRALSDGNARVLRQSISYTLFEFLKKVAEKDSTPIEFGLQPTNDQQHSSAFLRPTPIEADCEAVAEDSVAGSDVDLKQESDEELIL